MTSLTRSCNARVRAHKVTGKHANDRTTQRPGTAEPTGEGRLALGSEQHCAKVATILRQRHGEDEDRRKHQQTSQKKVPDVPLVNAGSDPRAVGVDTHRRSSGCTAEAGRHHTLRNAATCTDFPSGNRSKYLGGFFVSSSNALV